MNDHHRRGSFALGWQVIKAGIAGAVGTLVHYGILALCLYWFHWVPVLATGCGFLCGMVVNFVFNSGFVFRSKDPLHSTFLRFSGVALLGMAVNALIVYAGVQVMGINVWVCQVGATGMVFGLSFMINKVWTFRSPLS